MCGIVAYVGQQEAYPILIEGTLALFVVQIYSDKFSGFAYLKTCRLSV